MHAIRHGMGHLRDDFASFCVEAQLSQPPITSFKSLFCNFCRLELGDTRFMKGKARAAGVLYYNIESVMDAHSMDAINDFIEANGNKIAAKIGDTLVFPSPAKPISGILPPPSREELQRWKF